ncbi:MAG: AAA family ATPase, partial [Proteobacteria bacterium]|nr:AAA family ATPase [Pseudomonadota bacterium]
MPLPFADKTRFIHLLEEDPDRKACVFLRPWRFGKTLLTDMLLSYYDRSLAESFDETFRGTSVHGHRTPLAGSLYCVRLDFSQVSGCTEQAKSSF